LVKTSCTVAGSLPPLILLSKCPTMTTTRTRWPWSACTSSTHVHLWFYSRMYTEPLALARANQSQQAPVPMLAACRRHKSVLVGFTFAPRGLFCLDLRQCEYAAAGLCVCCPWGSPLWVQQCAFTEQSRCVLCVGIFKLDFGRSLR
jgi:hypothetical protein